MKNDLQMTNHVGIDWLMNFNDKISQHNIIQADLANEAGVSRSYVNQLLVGKRKLTSDMQQRLTVAYCKLTDENGLDICLDYLRISFPTHHTKELITVLFGIKWKYFGEEGFGRYGYIGRFWFGNMEIFYSEKEDKRGSLVELKGKGCRELENFLSAQHRTWYDFLDKALALEGNVKRIDLAINDYLNIIPVEYFIKKSQKNEFISKFKEHKYIVSDKAEQRGQTLYFGSRKSDIHFCLYQKDVEQSIRTGKELSETSIKNRFEIRLANERAELTVKSLLEQQDPGQTAFSIINNYLSFVRPVPNKVKKIWPVDSRWQQFIQGYEGKLRLTTKPVEIDLGQTTEWLKKQIAPTLKMVMAIDAAKGEETLMELIAGAKLKQKHLMRIDQMLAVKEDMLEDNGN